MHDKTAVLLAALLIAAPAAAQAGAKAATETGTQANAQAGVAEPAEPDAIALAFVEQFSDDHLSGMLSRIGGQSKALRAMGAIDGPTVATVFDAQIDAAVRQHGDEWARNMAVAWEPLLTETEMQSLVDEGADSPFAEKYVASREAAAASMAEISSALFGEILEEVVNSTIATLTPQEPEAEAPAK